ncbi:hypothetical protein FOZ62_006573, partial [Perkinsus olseni]
MSSALYAIPGFYGAVSSKRNSHRLLTAYNSIMRAVSGCLLATDVEKLPTIVGWEKLVTRVQRRAAHLAHMALRHPQLTPAQTSILGGTVKKKRKKLLGWRELSAEFLPQAFYPLISPLPHRLAPWLSLPIIFSASSCNKRDDSSVRKAAIVSALCTSRERVHSKPLWEIWFDGSVDSSIGHGGAGGAIWFGDEAEPRWSASAPAGMVASSYTAEI